MFHLLVLLTVFILLARPLALLAGYCIVAAMSPFLAAGWLVLAAVNHSVRVAAPRNDG